MIRAIEMWQWEYILVCVSVRRWRRSSEEWYVKDRTGDWRGKEAQGEVGNIIRQVRWLFVEGVKVYGVMWILWTRMF